MTRDEADVVRRGIRTAAALVTDDEPAIALEVLAELLAWSEAAAEAAPPATTPEWDRLMYAIHGLRAC